MQLMLDLYNAAGARIGEGPVTTLTSANVTRMLDGVGTITFEVPATDERALALLTTRTRFRLFAEYQSSKREIGRGVVLRRDLRESDAGALVWFECADTLIELKDANTLIGRKYAATDVGDIALDLVSLVSGWTVSIDASVAAKVVDARFDGASVLEALLQLCEDNGVHLRLGTGKHVEIGPFGAAAAVRAVNVEAGTSELYTRDDLALITSASAGLDSEEVVNWLLPLGGNGEDVATVKLNRSTRVSPYTIQMGFMPSGKKYWYIADAASIAAYGQSQRVAKFTNIKPISNTAADKVNASNALYDAAVAYLQRMKEPQKAYTLQLAALKQTVKPGEKLHVRYKGRVMKNGVPVDYASINEDLWLMKVTETFGLEGESVDVDVSNVDRTESTVEKTVVKALNEITLRGLTPAAGVSCRTYVYDREIADGVHCNVPLEITDATMEVVRVRVRLKTSPFRMVDHRHMVFQRVEYGGNVPTVGAALQVRMAGDGGGLGTFSAMYLPAVSDPATNLFTYGPASGAVNGVVDDTTTPVSVRLWINGVNRTTDFGGPWAAGGGALDMVLDVGLMTDAIVNAAGGLYGQHTIQFRCNSGHGRCEVTVEVYEVLQSIDVS
jgi:hypothetical protein